MTLGEREIPPAYRWIVERAASFQTARDMEESLPGLVAAIGQVRQLARKRTNRRIEFESLAADLAHVVASHVDQIEIRKERTAFLVEVIRQSRQPGADVTALFLKLVDMEH